MQNVSYIKIAICQTRDENDACIYFKAFILLLLVKNIILKMLFEINIFYLHTIKKIQQNSVIFSHLICQESSFDSTLFYFINIKKYIW